MSKKRKVEGNCHICGQYGELSYEHIPPEKAFNDRKVKAFTFEAVIDGQKKYIPLQRGYGEYSLCGSCNNITGHYYGDAYVDFVYQIIRIYNRTNGNIPAGEKLPFEIFPLRVFKQIITMFFTVNFESFVHNYPELKDYVLNKENYSFSNGLTVYAYLIKNLMSSRLTPGAVGVFNTQTNQSSLFSEFAFPPLGLLLSYDNNIIDSRLFNINFFNKYTYDEKANIELPLIQIDIENPMPGEYRTNKKILENNEEIQKENSERIKALD